MDDKQRLKLIRPYLFAIAGCLFSVAFLPLGWLTTGVFSGLAIVTAIATQIMWTALKQVK